MILEGSIGDDIHHRRQHVLADAPRGMSSPIFFKIKTSPRLSSFMPKAITDLYFSAKISAPNSPKIRTKISHHVVANFVPGE